MKLNRATGELIFNDKVYDLDDIGNPAMLEIHGVREYGKDFTFSELTNC